MPHGAAKRKKSITVFLNVLENKNYLESSNDQNLHDISWFSLNDKATG